MRFLRRLGIFVGSVLGLLIIAAGAVFIGARFADGPLGMLAGGPLRAGDMVTGAEPDWSFARDIPTIELQLLTPSRSRTTWILVSGGKPYIASGYMNSTVGHIWKQWPHEAERDGRVVVRIAGKRYERQLLRLTSGAAIAPLVAELNRKYGARATAETVASNDLWLFELAPRAR